MAEFKVVVNDAGKSYQVDVKGHHANSLIGKRIGEEVDGIFVSLPGCRLRITGGSDHDGFTMRKDAPGISRRKLLLTKSTGFKPKNRGARKRRTVCGNTITLGISQINMKIIKRGGKPVQELLAIEENAAGS